MRTLIIGCGYLGLRVADRLKGAGDRVFATTRSRDRARELAERGIEPIVADILDADSLSALPSVDRAFYAVGLDRGAGVPMRTLYVDGLRHVLGRLMNRSRRLVYAGSTGVHGDHGGDWIDEATPPAPLTDSGRACLEAEEAIRAFVETYHYPVTILRYAGLYGPGRLIRRSAIAAGEPIASNPETHLNLVHIDDAAAAAVLALDARAPGPLYLVADDRPVLRGEYYRLLAEQIGAPEPRFIAPDGDGPVRGDADKRVSNRRVREELGFRPVYPDIRTGLPAALEAEQAGDR